MCIFPFEVPLYEKFGIDVHYCGHPLVSQLPQKANRKEFFEKYALETNKKLVSVFPGSRVFELKNLMTVFIKSIEELSNKYPQLQFCISHAPNLSDEIFDKYFKNSKFKVIKGDNQALLSVSDALILASGTVALEACLYKTPMIIAYRGPKIFYWIYLLVRCLDKVSLPNIIANKWIIPELIEDRANVKEIVSNMEKILFDDAKKEDMINELSKVKDLLSEKNSAFEVAKTIDKELFN